MAWIQTVDASEATGELEAVYRGVIGSRGKLSNIMRVHSLRPAAMRAHMELYLELMFSASGLTRAERELIGVVVSAANACSYCVRHHAEALQAYWKNEHRVEAVIVDYRHAGLAQRLEAMLDYAVLLTREPSAVMEAHVEELRRAGFTDEDILHINLITSYFNFVNRIAEGLGVEFTDEEARGFRY